MQPCALTNAEMATFIGMSPQNLGRVLNGQIQSVSDRYAGKLLQLAGLRKEPAPMAGVRTTLSTVQGGDGDIVSIADIQWAAQVLFPSSHLTVKD